MRILVFSTAYHPFVGGAEVAIHEIAERLPEHDWQLVTARLSRSVPRYEKHGNVHIHRVGLGNPTDKFLLPILGLVKALSIRYQGKVDLVWSMMASQASIAAAFYKKLFPSTPLVVSLQEGDEEEHLKRYVGGNEFLYKLLIRPWHRLALRSANRVTAISEYLRGRAYAAGVKSEVTLVPNGVDLEFFAPASTPKVTDKTILFTTSRLVEKNGNEYIIRALPLLPSNVVFWLVGVGPLEKYLKDLVLELGVGERVFFLGSPTRTEIQDRMRQAHIFIRPSLSEGLGISFLEAMAAKVPIVATLVGGIVDFLIPDETGLVCEPKNPESTAHAIKKLIDDPALAHKVTDNAYALVHERYDWKKIAPAIDGVFKKSVSKIPTFLIATGIYPPDIGGPATYAKGLYDALALEASRTQVLTYGIEKRLPTGIRHLVTFFKICLTLPFVDGVIALDTFSVGLPAVVAAKLFRKKCVVRIGGDFLWEQYVNRTHEDIVLSEFYSRHRAFTPKERFISACTGFVLRGATGLVFSTKWQKDFMIPAYDVPSTVPVGVIENFEGVRMPPLTPKKKNFIWAGRDIFLKNTIRMRIAFEKARRARPDIELELCEHIPHDELLARVQRAYAIILPSLSEVSPNFLLEGVACGKPFVATRESGYSERFAGLGLFFDPRSIDDIANAMIKLADDAVYRECTEKLAAYSHVHTYRDIAREWVDFFETLKK